MASDQKALSPNTPNSLAVRLTVRYVFALTVVALLVTGGHLFMRQALEAAESDSRVINLAGRQRMLSQRMVKDLAALALEPRVAGSVWGRLDGDLTAWVRTHAGLLEGDAELGLPPAKEASIRQMLVALDPDVQELQAQISTTLMTRVPPDQTLLRAAIDVSNRFVERMDALVFEWDALSKRQIERLKQVAQVSWLLALLTLVAEAVFIFRPFARWLADSEASLCSQQHVLAENALLLEQTGELAGVGGWELALDRRAFVPAPQAAKLLGLSAGCEMPLADFVRMVVADARAVLERSIDKAIADGGAWDVELPLVNVAGREMWLRVVGRAVREQGRTVRVFGALQDVTNMRSLAYQASTDALTGLPNRRHFLARLTDELARVQRMKRHAALLMLDLDHFKQINDRYGHAAGDLVLQRVAVALNDAVRATDVAGRIGGEEFAVLMPESALDQARQLAERIRAAVQALNVVYGEVSLGVTVSIGLVELDASSTADQALSLADKALYSAKAHGRNRVEAALPADH